MSLGDNILDLMKQREFIPVQHFTGLQQIAFTPVYTATDGSTTFAYTIADALGADKVADSEDTDVAAASLPATNDGYIVALDTFTNLTGTPVVAHSPDYARNLVVYVSNDSGGPLNMYEGVMTFAVVGKFQGSAQAENITFTNDAGHKALATANFRIKNGVKPFDTVTSVTITNAAAATLKAAVGLGNVFGLPMNGDTNTEADIIKITKNAADLDPTGTFSASNKTVSLNGADTADGLDATIVYKIDYDGAAGTIAEIPVDSLIASAADATVVIKELPTLGISGLLMTADNDIVYNFMRIPSDWDRQQPIKVRVIWCSNSTDTTHDAATWVFSYEQITLGTTNIAAVNDALDTAIAIDYVEKATAYVPQATPWGVINPKTIADAAEYMEFSVKMATNTHSIGAIYCFGVEFEYSPKLTGLRHNIRPSREWVP